MLAGASLSVDHIATLPDGSTLILRAGTTLRERSPEDRTKPGVIRSLLWDAKRRLREIMPAENTLAKCKHDAKARAAAESTMGLLDRALAALDLT